jgi:hypothetical protein
MELSKIDYFYLLTCFYKKQTDSITGGNIFVTILYIINYIVYNGHKVVSCKMEQIQDRLKPDPVINFIVAGQTL